MIIVQSKMPLHAIVRRWTILAALQAAHQLLILLTRESVFSRASRIFRARGDNEKRRRNIPSGQLRQVFVFPGGICDSPMKSQVG